MSNNDFAVLDPRGAAPEGTLELNSVSLHRSCIQAQDLSMLTDGADFRGGDIQVPGSPGVYARPRIINATRRDVPFWLIGAFDWTTGDEVDDKRQGLIDNFDALYSSIGIGNQVGDGTVYCVLTEPDGSTRSNDVTVLACRRGTTRAGWWTPVVISLNLPVGELTP